MDEQQRKLAEQLKAAGITRDDIKQAMPTATAESLKATERQVSAEATGQMGTYATPIPANWSPSDPRAQNLLGEQWRVGKPPTEPAVGQPQPASDVFDRYRSAAENTRPAQHDALRSEHQEQSAPEQPQAKDTIFDRYRPQAAPEPTPQPTKEPARDRD